MAVKVLINSQENRESSECEDFRVDVCGDAASAFRSLFTQKLPHTYEAEECGRHLVTLFLLGGLTLCIEPLASSRAH